MKDKQRRQRLREEKLEGQRQVQEERIQRALERARAPVKKKSGRMVVFRSAPPMKKKKREDDTKKKEEGINVLNVRGFGVLLDVEINICSIEPL